MSDLTRRDLLKGAVATGLAASLAEAAVPRQPDLVREENRRPGSTDWQLSKYRIDARSRCRSTAIEGYCSRTSVKAGEVIELFVSTQPASPFTIDLYRMGYYGGKGGRHVARLGPFKGSVQPDPEEGKERLRQCRWEAATRLTVPKDWPSGVYLGKLTAEKDGWQSYVIFIVKDGRPCDLLFQCSDNTWCAYNRWPDTYSLYDLDNTDKWYTGPGVAAGFARPYGKYRQVVDAPQAIGSGEFLFWEFPFAYWLEKEGYDVSYISNLDTHADARRLLAAGAFLSIGHDEYWSLAMYENVKAALAGGVSAGFFSGNAVDGVVEIVDGRALARVGKFGGDIVPRDKPLPWKQHGPDPALLMGAASTYPFNGGASWTCVNDKHWLFAGTGMKNGDAIPDLVGWEHHGKPARIEGLEVVARGPIFSRKKPQGVEYTATVYPGPKDNIVFNAATIWWADGLSQPPGYVRPAAHGASPRGADPRVQKITANVLKRF